MRKGTLAVSGLLLLAGAWFTWGALEFPNSRTLGDPGAGRIPLLFGVLTMLLAGALIAATFCSRSYKPVHFPHLPRVAAVAGIGIVYAGIMPWVGFYAATAIFMVAALAVLKSSWMAIAGTTAGFLGFVLLVFDLFLKVPLP